MTTDLYKQCDDLRSYIKDMEPGEATLRGALHSMADRLCYIASKIGAIEDSLDGELLDLDDDDDPKPARPFATLPSLPPDVTDAFESFKLCILRHKLSGWQEISRDDLIVSLEALVDLARGPVE